MATISNGARQQAAALELDIEVIAAQHTGGILGVQDVMAYARERGLVPAPPPKAPAVRRANAGRSTPAARSAPAPAPADPFEGAWKQRMADRQERKRKAATPAVPLQPAQPPQTSVSHVSVPATHVISSVPLVKFGDGSGPSPSLWWAKFRVNCCVK